MTPEQLRDVVLHLLHEVAPGAAIGDLSPDDRLSDALQLDALDFLSFIIAVHETLGVDVPERDYPQLATLGGCVDYLAGARGERGRAESRAGSSAWAGMPQDPEIAEGARSADARDVGDIPTPGNRPASLLDAAPGTMLGARMGMLIRHLMQRDVVTLRVTDTLGLADDIMELGRIRHLPVVSANVVVGIVSQRDLYRAAVSSMLQMSRSEEREWLGKIPVVNVMASNVVTVAPEATIHTAIELMLSNRIGCLPVVEHGKLVGLISETDCLRYLAHVLGTFEEKAGLPELPQ